MKIYLRLSIILMTVALLASLSFRGASRIVRSAGEYRSVLREKPLPPGDALPAKTGRVVVVVISGLSADALTHLPLPTLNTLREAGATATVVVLPPTYRRPVWTNLVSGAPAALNDAPPFEVFNPENRPATVETIFDTVRRQSGQVMVVGNALWQEMFPGSIRFWPMPADEADFLAGEGAGIAAMLDDGSVRLAVFQFDHLFAAAQAPGEGAENYLRAAGQVDRYLSQLLHALNMDETTLIITSDFGLLAGGRRGGGDFEVVNLPLIMTGKDIIPGRYSPVHYSDLAPTLAALVGAAIPNRTQGRPLLEMMRLSEGERAQILAQLAHQRVSLTQAYLAALGFNSPQMPADDLSRADAFLANKNYAGAAQLAALILKQTETLQQKQETAAQAQTKRFRLGVLSASLGLLLLFALKTRSALWLEAVLGAGVALGVYHLLYRFSNLPYSLSAVTGPLTPLWPAVLPWVATGVLAGALGFTGLSLFKPKTPPTMLLNGSFELVLFTALGFLAPALYGFWQIGPEVQQFFPNVQEIFYYVAALSQTWFSVVIGTFVPLFVIVLNFGMQKGIIWYQMRRLG